MVQIQNSRQRCVFERYDDDLFFSLVCYRNNLFTSNDPDKIIEFYNGFDNRDQLIQWMKERPKGVSYIHEVDGYKDIVVVIPTADFNGKYATTCREEIFKGLHMIFVESGENPDPYFNYAHNCNVGIKKAIEYNPKWVVVSNDDIETENIQKLISVLQNATGNYYVPKNTRSNTENQAFSVPRLLFALYALYRLKKDGLQKYILTIKTRNIRIFRGNFTIFSRTYGLFFKLLLIFATPISSSFKNFYDFGIFNTNVLREDLYDETFINGNEDFELCNRLANHGVTAKTLDFVVDSLKGGGNTLGKGESLPRGLRDLSTRFYLTYIWTHSAS